MELIQKEIEKATTAGLYYLGLATALTLPDICAALCSANDLTSKAQFIT